MNGSDSLERSKETADRLKEQMAAALLGMKGFL